MVGATGLAGVESLDLQEVVVDFLAEVFELTLACLTCEVTDEAWSTEVSLEWHESSSTSLTFLPSL